SQKRSRVRSESNDSRSFKMPRLGEGPEEHADEVDLENLRGVESEEESDAGVEDSAGSSSETSDVSDDEQDSSQTNCSTSKNVNKIRSVENRKRQSSLNGGGPSKRQSTGMNEINHEDIEEQQPHNLEMMDTEYDGLEQSGPDRINDNIRTGQNQDDIDLSDGPSSETPKTDSETPNELTNTLPCSSEQNATREADSATPTVTSPIVTRPSSPAQNATPNVDPATPNVTRSSSPAQNATPKVDPATPKIVALPSSSTQIKSTRKAAKKSRKRSSNRQSSSPNEESTQQKNEKWEKYCQLMKIKPADLESKTRDEVLAFSQMWISMCAIDSVRTEDEAAHTPEGKIQLKRITDKVKEIGCIREVKALEALPEQNGYRGLGPAFEEALLSASIPINTPVKASSIGMDQPPPQCSFATPALMNPFTSTGADVVREVEEAAKNNTVAVFEDTSKDSMKKHFESYRKGAAEEEQKYYEEFCSPEANQKCQEQMDAGCYPVPSFTVTSRSQEKEIEEIMKTSSACLFPGLAGVYGIDLSKFKAINVLRKSKSDTVDIRQELAQPTFLNFKYPLATQPKYSGVTCESKIFGKEKFNKEDFMDHYAAVEKLAKEARKQIGEEGKDAMEVARALGKELSKLSLEVSVADPKNITDKAATKSFKPECLLTAFCPSFDLTVDDAELNAEIRKFPLSMQPNGEKDQMRHGDKELPGINGVQCYFKFPGCRTVLHNEDYVLTSFNINVGEGPCVWYLIPREYTEKVHELLEKQKIFSKFVTKESPIWLHAKDLIMAGIKFHKIVQEPGVMMFTGVATYHFVQSVGFADNVSWNVMMPTFTQLACSAVQHDFYVAHQYRSAVPIHQIIWQMAIKKQEVDGKTKKLLKAMLMRSLATTKKQELYIRNVLSTRHELFEFKNVKEMESRGETHEIQSYSMCLKCDLVLFNYIPVARNRKGEYYSCCFQCLRKNAKEVTVYEFNTIKELEEVFDSVQLND
ncbi:unnamed protein product, partial [Caenorhabditis brenneri]